MQDFIVGEDLEPWNIIEQGPKISMAKDDNRRETGSKTRDEFTNEDIKAVQNNVKAKKVLIYGFGPDEYSQSSCNNAKKVCNTLQTTHEGMSRPKTTP